MPQVYEHKCCRCGFCCLSENCITSQIVYGIPKHGVLCPALHIDEKETACLLAEPDPVSMGIGAGCCIKARAYRNGIEYDFASLPDELKHLAFRQNYQRKFKS